MPDNTPPPSLRGCLVQLGRFFATILLGIPVALLRGLVLSDMWGWFIVPLGAPALGIINAIGLTFVAAFITLRGKDVADLNKPLEKRKLLTLPLNSIAISLFFWLFAWIWSMFL